jgi:predicted RNA-binding protein with PUA-like domain
MNCWLLKSEPGAYSIADLERDGRTFWDGVRNYQARNYLRDQIKEGDPVLFYHSNAEPMAVVGTAIVARAGYPDHTALDMSAHHYDPKSTPENPIWYMVDISYRSTFRNPVSLEAMKEDAELAGMVVTKKGSRLSVQPVSEAHFRRVCQLGEDPAVLA